MEALSAFRCAAGARWLVVGVAVATWASSVAGAWAGPPTLPATAAASSVASFPCPHTPVSTLDLEACEGKQLLALDRSFNERSALIWSLLDGAGRREFARANGAWLSYRDAECQAGARAYLGGSAAAVEYGACEVELTHARDQDLLAMAALYCQGSTPIGRYRSCPRPSSPRAGAGTH